TKLAAVLVRHPNRMPSLLRKARIVDDPGLDRSITLDRWQHQLAHLAQHLVVRPSSFTNKMQQRLMLRRRSLRCRDCRHRLYALALTRHHQSYAVVVQWRCPIRMPDHAHKPLDIAHEPRFNVLRFVETHPKPLTFQPESSPYLILKSLRMWPYDSVVLGGFLTGAIFAVPDDPISCRLDWSSAPRGSSILLARTCTGGVAV